MIDDKELHNYEQIFIEQDENAKKRAIKNFILLALKSYLKKQNPILTEIEIENIANDYEQIIDIRIT